MGDGSSEPSKVQKHHRPGSGVGEVPFPQNNYRFPHVAVHEVDMEVGTRHFLPLAVPHREPNGYGRSREGDPLEPGIRCG